MMPESATSPVANAPADRPSIQLEQVCRQLIALIFADRVMDDHEKAILRATLEEIQLRGQAAGGQIGTGASSGTEPPTEQPGAEPADPNATQDFGTAEGAEPTTDDEGY